MSLARALNLAFLRENLRRFLGRFCEINFGEITKNSLCFLRFVLSLNLLALKPLGDFVEKALLLVI